jgi:hypothetical protein
MIDWTDKTANVTEHFTVGDCLTLHNWNRLATESDGADVDKLTTLCQSLEQVRSILGCPINVHCMFRSKAYNLEQNILPPTGADVHSMSMAVDFDAGSAMTIDQVKNLLGPWLAKLNLRMEFGTTTWVHIDNHPVGNSRYFHP